MKADSGATQERAFCEQCGAGIWIRKIDDKTEKTNLKAGLFERSEICGPSMENWMKVCVLVCCSRSVENRCLRLDSCADTGFCRTWNGGRLRRRALRDKLWMEIESLDEPVWLCYFAAPYSR